MELTKSDVYNLVQSRYTHKIKWVLVGCEEEIVI